MTIVRDRTPETDTRPNAVELGWRPVTAVLRVVEAAERERARVLRDSLTPPAVKARRVEVIAERVVGELKILLRVGIDRHRRKVRPSDLTGLVGDDE